MPPLDQSYCEIPLTQGQVALVSVEDYSSLSKVKWSARWSKMSKSFYAVRHSPTVNGKRGTWLMHRVILGLSCGDKREGDHINHNTLDNRRQNLRIATHFENTRNARRRKDNTSGFKGVSAWKGKWKVQISFDGKQRYVGLYKTPEEGHAAYCKYANEYHQEFACHGHELTPL